jgi:hypothetical protein
MTIPIQPKAAWLTAGLVLAFIVGWESYWRAQRYELSYNDDVNLWASTRQQIYESNPARPVLIGSSRIKFDLDLPAWERITGQRPIQLSLEGTSPRPMLTDLGNDPNFRGTLLIDVTEGLFFSPGGSFPEKAAAERVKGYPRWSLSEQVAFRINGLLESRLLFLDNELLTISPLLKKLPIPNRPGAWGGPAFPDEFTVNDPDRQTRMTARFVADTNLQNQVKHVWQDLVAHSPKDPLPAPLLTQIMDETKRSVDQIRARGGRVLFVRTPSDGWVYEGEKHAFPRARYWDRLLAHTRTPGIYFADYPALSRYRCPEWSHLTPADAVRFTEALIPIVRQKTGWPVPQRAVGSSSQADLSLR